MDFEGARDHIIKRLTGELHPDLFYHSPAHTLDVWDSARMIAGLEGIGGTSLRLIETAALYHDAGMLDQYQEHELASETIARAILPEFGYSPDETEEVVRLILTTRMPQKASDLFGQILCDADLDYLGREDFLIHSLQLRLEWERFGIFRSTLREWFEMQIQFLDNHHYFTATSKKLRDQKKSENLTEIVSLIR